MTGEALPPCFAQDGGFSSLFDNEGCKVVEGGAGHPDGANGASWVQCKREQCGASVVVDPNTLAFDQIAESNLCASALAPFCKLLKQDA